jgi:hypothetical protein
VDDDGVGVVTVSDELTATLAAAGGGQLAEAAVSWSQFQDIQGADPSGLAGFLGELAALARRQLQEGAPVLPATDLAAAEA